MRTDTVAVSSPDASDVKIIIQGRHLEVTDSIRQYAEQKISKALSKHCGPAEVREVDVRCSVSGGDAGKGERRQRTEVTVYTTSGIVRSEEEDADLYSSIDRVSDKLGRKLRKRKERLGKGARHAAPRGEDLASLQATLGELGAPLEEEEQDAFEYQEVVREKFFPIAACSIQDAIAEMESVGHSFYAFRSLEDDEINIVYRRNAGGYGRLIPVDVDVNDSPSSGAR